MGKKIVKIIGIILLLCVAVLVAAPFFLEAKIETLIRNNVNNNVNATFDFESASLSLIKSFPNASLSIEEVTLVNKAPFEGDTLFAAKDLSLTLGIAELFKAGDEPIGVKDLSVDGANIHVIVNKEEVANYEIGKDDGNSEEPSTEESDGGFTLDLQSYEITNSKVVYDDRAAKVYLDVSDIQHNGTGDLSATTSELDTATEAVVSFTLDSTNYLNKNPIKLDAVIGVDLKADKYTFLKNEALINKLPLVFDGFVKVNEHSQDIDLSFKTPSSDFKNFLAVIPEVYAKNIEDVKTTGDFKVEGRFNGVVDETHIPKFDIKIRSNNASFKYADLPKTVRNVFIDVDAVNSSGIVEETYVAIKKLSFMIDEDKFNMVATLKNLLGNTKVNAAIDGRMNLANIEKAYPVPADLDLKGILTADVKTVFDMASIEKNQYENTNTTGTMSLSDFEYASAEMPQPVKLSNTAVTFNSKTVRLNSLNGTTGKTDFDATGTIDNLLGFMFNDEKVAGNFNLNSNTFALNDFMVADESAVADKDDSSQGDTTGTTEEKIKIPSFLDATIHAKANTVLYDDLVLKDVNGDLKIKDEKAILSDMTTTIFGGKMAFDGEVSTKNETPTFAMKLGMSQLRIGETFKSLALLKSLAPIAGVLKGKLDSDIALSGALTDDLTPDLLTLSGDMLAKVMTNEVDASSAPMLTALAGKLDFLDLKKLDLKDLVTRLSFKDGVVQVKPFTVNYQDIAIEVDGSHTFDKKLNYKAKMEVPAKYLGSEVNELVGKLDEKELENLTIPVVANIGGDFENPKVSTDMTSGVKTLTSRLIEIQKQKLINKGKDKANDLLGDILGNKDNKKDDDKNGDPTKNSGEEAVKGILNDVLGGNKKDAATAEKDTVPAKKEDAVKEKAKDILGGLFGKKKKNEK